MSLRTKSVMRGRNETRLTEVASIAVGHLSVAQHLHSRTYILANTLSVRGDEAGPSIMQSNVYPDLLRRDYERVLTSTLNSGPSITILVTDPRALRMLQDRSQEPAQGTIQGL
ncbi:hypothetical protein V8C26DRAFT_388043 [Trichoderma gracile]